MTTAGRLVTGLGGVLLLVALFLEWAGERTGWELWTMADVFLLVAAIFAIAAAASGGGIGVFRPDVSVNGAADLFGVVATVLLAWPLIFDFPSGADPEIGAFLALVGAAAIAGGSGDYSTLRGAPMFPRLSAGERRD
jgi:hypothetical protein